MLSVRLVVKDSLAGFQQRFCLTIPPVHVPKDLYIVLPNDFTDRDQYHDSSAVTTNKRIRHRPTSLRFIAAQLCNHRIAHGVACVCLVIGQIILRIPIHRPRRHRLLIITEQAEAHRFPLKRKAVTSIEVIVVDLGQDVALTVDFLVHFQTTRAEHPLFVVFPMFHPVVAEAQKLLRLLEPRLEAHALVVLDDFSRIQRRRPFAQAARNVPASDAQLEVLVLRLVEGYGCGARQSAEKRYRARDTVE
nr:hypothetical protein CFP56_30937 [Quercus suber]